VEANGRFGVPIHEIDLSLQLLGGEPVIIALKKCQILARCGSDSPSHNFVGVQVLFREYQPYQARMACGILLHDLPGPIRGTIFAH
jgi:hypothetical protein